jgi:biotin carboxylase
MISNLKDKKLLVLGANIETIPLIETAKLLGVYVIVTDFNPNAPAKKVATKSYDVDGFDIDGLIKLCEVEKVNGVMVGVADRLITPYFQLCSKLGLPCYATQDQCNYLTNKQKFNELCSQFSIKTIPNYNSNYLDKQFNLIEYPVFVKPTDSNSGKGMSICNNLLELDIAVEKAIEASKTQSYLIERYMRCDDIFIYYTFKDGEVFLSAIADRFTTDKQGNVSRVCIQANYPSKYLKHYEDTLHWKMDKMFKYLKVENGVFMISAFVEKDEIYLYDPGFRLQGEAPNIPIYAINGFDQKEMLIRFALNGNMGNTNLAKKNVANFNNFYSTTIWFLVGEGEITEVRGIEDLTSDPNVIRFIQRLFIGDVVTKEMVGTEAQVFARLYLKFNSKNDYLDRIEYFRKSIQVLGLNNVSILIN